MRETGSVFPLTVALLIICTSQPISLQMTFMFCVPTRAIWLGGTLRSL
jgi:hypothetical protein